MTFHAKVLEIKNDLNRLKNCYNCKGTEYLKQEYSEETIQKKREDIVKRSSFLTMEKYLYYLNTTSSSNENSNYLFSVIKLIENSFKRDIECSCKNKKDELINKLNILKKQYYYLNNTLYFSDKILERSSNLDELFFDKNTIINDIDIFLSFYLNNYNKNILIINAMDFINLELNHINYDVVMIYSFECLNNGISEYKKSLLKNNFQKLIFNNTLILIHDQDIKREFYYELNITKILPKNKEIDTKILV